MKDSQPATHYQHRRRKYIKENNERFSTLRPSANSTVISISRRIMKDSQPCGLRSPFIFKYIKENNERFSTSYPALEGSN